MTGMLTWRRQLAACACIAAVSGALLLLAFQYTDSVQRAYQTYTHLAFHGAEPMQQEVRHVVFSKVHKAASCTVQNVFLRFALSRQLNILLPRKGNILNIFGGRLPSIADHPKSPPFLFDILCNHFNLNVTEVRRYFPGDTKYVAIVRQPLDLIKSAFYFFKRAFVYLVRTPSFDHYVADPLRYEPLNVSLTFTMNRMSIDLGLPLKQFWNTSYSHTFVEHLDRTFDLVLVVERFAESMVLLKRTLHWQTKDILYMKQNQGTYKKTKMSDILEARLMHLNYHDVAVYKHFVDEFQKKVAAEGPSFQEEVKSYSSMLKTLSRFCTQGIKNGTRALAFSATKWNKKFTVNDTDCTLMRKYEIPLVNYVRQLQLERLAPLIQKERSKRT